MHVSEGENKEVNDMDLATCAGICIVGGAIFTFVSMARAAHRKTDELDAEQSQAKASRHPILYSIIGGIIAWKVLETWNRSRRPDGFYPHEDSSPGASSGRSVYDDLNLS